jgi:hypothetical protein
VEGRENAANAARDADPTLRKKPKKPTKAANLASVDYEAYSKVSSRRCTIAEIFSQLQIRGVNPGHTTKNDALLRLWDTNSDLPERGASGGGVLRPLPASSPRPVLAAAGGGVLRPLPASSPRPVLAAAGGGVLRPLPASSPRPVLAAAAADPAIVKSRVCTACKQHGHQKTAANVRCAIHWTSNKPFCSFCTHNFEFILLALHTKVRRSHTLLENDTHSVPSCVEILRKNSPACRGRP